MFDSLLPISYYQEIATLNSEHQIMVVQHRETGKIYLKKILPVYHLDIYSWLFHHPVKGIPRIYAMYEKDHTLTLIEEYISGDTLQEVLEICGPLPPKTAADYLIALCDILTQLHQAQPPIVHRDLKPSNLILTEDERIILIDLNAARPYIPGKNRDTQLLGTEDFAAPEQFGFGTSSPQTDIYACGVLMQTLLTGSTDTTQPVTGALGHILRKCLQISPKERYSSATQLKKALLRARRFL